MAQDGPPEPPPGDFGNRVPDGPLSPAKVGPAKHVFYWLFFPSPALADCEVVLWTKVVGWVKGGKLTKGGRLFLTSEGGILWKSARYEIPKAEWSTPVSELGSAEIVQGSAARKARAPFAAGIRTTCVLNTTDGITRILVPSEAGRILLKVLETDHTDVATAIALAGSGQAK
jgi:hypothetical protein